MKKAVILLNMGGPNGLDEVEVFLKNMFNDPRVMPVKSKILRKFIAFMITKSRREEAKENYRKIGSKSPIVDITQSLVDKINSLLNGSFKNSLSKKEPKNLEEKSVVFDFAMRYTSPFSKEVLSKYTSFDEIVLLPLYPHHSTTTISSSLDAANLALKDLNFKGKVRVIDEFYESSEYNEICLNLIEDEISSLSKDEISKTTLLFSAHSLPESIIKKGDLYQKQVEKHVEILSDLLKKRGINFKETMLSYQSKLGPVKWLGPNTDAVISELKSKRVVIFPIAFCIDNSETDYELSIQYKELSIERNFEFYRVCKCPNDRDDFAKFLINLSK